MATPPPKMAASSETQTVPISMPPPRSRPSVEKYAKHADYFKFRDRVWEVNHEDAMPPLGDLLPREDGDSDVESDIEFGGMTQDYNFPLTLMPLTDPLTSKTCRHSFSATPIREYIATGGGRMKCPATGCNENLTLNDLEADDDVATVFNDMAGSQLLISHCHRNCREV
ncbi:hypothetical protein JB92DRAFT_3093644 [Gautieria morchelliformis]|nr:hypothetical protein JB92DRAFT_3093644 [Gautieria morchelliformis]